MNGEYRTGGYLAGEEVNALLAFIDARKAAVGELEAAENAATMQRARAKDAEQERDRLREEIAIACRSLRLLTDCDILSDRSTLSELITMAERDHAHLMAELSALKARPVVDVQRALKPLRELERSMRQERCVMWLGILNEALESLQPASAKADEKPMGEHNWLRALDGAYDPHDWRCLNCGKEVDGAEPSDRGCPGKADEKPSADPARVGEEEQERRLRLASGWLECKETHRVQLGGHAIILDMIVEYLRAEREGRKAT
jgi:hypothetical protein